MQCLHRVVAVGALVVVGLCGWGHGQQVLEQVPSDAVGVFEVKDLQGLSTKVAKFAKALGVDQFDPRWADPLASVEDEMGLKQGVNKNGDLAIAFMKPAHEKDAAPADSKPKADAAEEEDAPEVHGANEPSLVVLIPTDDYKAFLANFQDVKDAGDNISEVTVPKNKEKLFVIERGKYAVAAMDKSLLSNHAGLKLQGPAAKEAQSKDAILYFDVQALRPELQKGMKQAREEIERQRNNANGDNANPFAGAMTPGMQKLIDQYMKVANRLVADTRSATISFNLTDAGIATAALGDFEPDSYLGKLVAQVQNTDEPLLVGLPDATYFAFGGAKLTPEVVNQLFNEFLAPLKKDMANTENGANISKAFDSLREALAATKTVSSGYISGGGAPGRGLLNTVAVAHGDANKILEGQKGALPALASFFNMAKTKNSAEINFGQAKTVDGVDIQPYTMQFNFDANDPRMMQAKQLMSMLYGPNGLSGVMGVVNDNTYIQVQGGDDKLLSDVIAAAKNGSDTLDKAANVKEVAAQLPKQRVMEYYVALDNIVSAGVKFARQQGMAVQFRLPPNLPPIGVAAGAEGSVVRIDAVIPTQLVQSITAAAMQAFMQMNGGPGAGQGGGI